MYRNFSATAEALSARLASAARTLSLVVAGALAACGGGGDSAEPPPPPPPPSVVQHPLGGTVTGLTGTLVLANGNGAEVTITASGSYVTNVAQGQTYTIVVRTQPVGQTCVVENGTGVVTPRHTSCEPAVAAIDSVMPTRPGPITVGSPTTTSSSEWLGR